MGDVSGELFTMLVEEGVGIFSGFVVQLFFYPVSEKTFCTMLTAQIRIQVQLLPERPQSFKCINTNTGGLHHWQSWRGGGGQLSALPDSPLSSHQGAVTVALNLILTNLVVMLIPPILNSSVSNMHLFGIHELT